MTGYGWLATGVTVAILPASVRAILVMLMGQKPCVFYTMSNDGLIPKFWRSASKIQNALQIKLILFVLLDCLQLCTRTRSRRLTSFGYIAGICAGWVSAFDLREEPEY